MDIEATQEAEHLHPAIQPTLPKASDDAILAETAQVSHEEIMPPTTDTLPSHLPISSALPSTSSESSLPPRIHNFRQELLTPWSTQGTKIFLDICSGSERPLSRAIQQLGLPNLAIDILIDQRMDILDDFFYEQLLRLCGSGVVGYAGASPSCTEYSLLKLRPGGPRPIRTPEMVEGLPNLSSEEQQRLQDSASLLDRSVQAVSCTFIAGGHGHVEQPSGAMSWREQCTKNWMLLANCSLILLAACGFDWDIKKTWLFASSFSPLADLAVVCNHPFGSHQSIAGVRDEHGIFMSRRSATYPDKLAQAFAGKISVLLTPSQNQITWDNVFQIIPTKDWFQDPKSFVDGGGLVSNPDWSRPPGAADNLFKAVRDHWIPLILQRNLHKLIVSHFQQHRVEPPFPETLIQEFRDSLDSLLPIPQRLDWQVRDDQPLCLHALWEISKYMQDLDTQLFPALIEGVSTGFHDKIPPSNVFAPKPEMEEPTRPDLSVHWTNWHSAESQPALTSELVQEEISKGWLVCFDGSLEDAKTTYPLGVAVGKLGIATSDTRPPRLVVDFTVSGTNHNCDIPEHQQLPSAKDVVRSYPLRGHSEELGALGLDVKSAHKLCVLHHTHRGLVGFSFQGKLYFYKVCPFGARFGGGPDWDLSSQDFFTISFTLPTHYFCLWTTICWSKDWTSCPSLQL